MGLRGPAPKPTMLRILQGNPGKVKINLREPKPETAPEILAPPKWLNETGRAIFLRLRLDLPWLTVADVDLFAGYCNAFARWRQAEDFLATHGMTYTVHDVSLTGKKGPIKFVQSYPQVAHSAKYYSQMIAAGRELGLSPSSRTRIKAGDVPKSPVKSKAEEMFG